MTSVPRSFFLRSLLSQSLLWIALPLALVMAGVLAAGLYAYQATVQSLLIDRDRQLAALSAVRISEALEGYARVLEALASNPDLRSSSDPVRMAAVQGASEALGVFNAGVIVTDAEGRVQTVAPGSGSPVGSDVGAEGYFKSVKTLLKPEFSNILLDARSGEDTILVAVPVFDDASAFAGALLGAVHIHSSPLGEPVRKLAIGDEGFAYLVDGTGRVVFHPDAGSIGADFSERPFVRNVVDGASGGAVWTAPGGDRLVIGYAPVEAAGWGLIVREPWDTVTAPARRYGLLVTAAGLLAMLLAGLMLWLGVRRITAPVRQLVLQAAQLATGEAIHAIPESGISEIDALEQAFSQMAARIDSYRAGLRRYVGAVTKSQEEERRRLARELHDETTQSLLGLNRHMELYQASETDPARVADFAPLLAMVGDILREVRQISRDLRPLTLEDLGLVPALETLIQSFRDGQPSGIQVDFEITGQETGLAPDRELALYRILQEALNNVRRHAAASLVQVRIWFEPAAVRLQIRDNGRGFVLPGSLTELAQRDSFGLMGIQERVWAAGGTLTLNAEPGRGTCVDLTIPRI